jgi:tyrosyl-tRNA synthetase
VGRYLRLFTLIPLNEVETLVEEHMKDPSARKAQHRLAYEVLTFIHGAVEADKVADSHKTLFRKRLPGHGTPSSPIKTKNPDAVNPILNPNAPQTNSESSFSPNATLPKSLVFGRPLSRILYNAGLVSSHSEGNRLIKARGAYVAAETGIIPEGREMPDELKWVPIDSADPANTEKYIMGGHIIMLRVGKWKVRIIKIIPDEEFDQLGLDAPGWKDFKAEKSTATL